MGFAQKLSRICEKAEGKANRLLSRQATLIALHVARVIKSGSWEYLRKQSIEDLGSCTGKALDAAELGDAAEFIRNRVLDAPNGKVFDVKLTPGLRSTQATVVKPFADREVPHRGFVYVAWAARPVTFLYVGKASSVKRLTLTSHGNLANAAAYATTISMIFPNRSSESTLRGVEAALLCLIRSSAGEFPELNTREEVVPKGSYSGRLKALSGFFGLMSDVVNPFVG